MATRNEELARRGLDAFSRGALEESLATMAEDVEWHIAFRLPDLPPELEVARGHEQVREVWVAFRSVWDRLTVDVEEVLYDANDVLVARVRFHGRGTGSGVDVNRTLFYVLEIRGGLLIRIRPFDDLADAWRAAGIEA